MAKDRNMMLVFGVAIAAVLVATGTVSLPGFSVGGADGGDEVRDFEPGESASVDVRTFDATEDSRTQVDGGTVYTSNGAGTISDSSGSASSAFTFTYSTGDTLDVWTHSSNYPYGELKEDVLVDSEQKNIQLNTYEGEATSDITITVNEEDGTFNDGSVDAPGADGTVSFEGLDVKVDSANAAYNPVLLGAVFENSTALAGNFSSDGVQMPSAESVPCPDHDSDLDKCWVAFDGSQEAGTAPSLTEFETASDQGNIVVEAGSSGVDTTSAAGTQIWLRVMDYADFQDKNDQLARGAEDDTSSPSDVGVADVTQTIDFE